MNGTTVSYVKEPLTTQKSNIKPIHLQNMYIHQLP